MIIAALLMGGPMTKRHSLGITLASMAGYDVMPAVSQSRLRAFVWTYADNRAAASWRSVNDILNTVWFMRVAPMIC